MDYAQIITIDPGKRSGKACIRDLRITVYDVLDYLAAGMTEDEILADFPDLSESDIRACLAYAADAERRLAIVPLCNCCSMRIFRRALTRRSRILTPNRSTFGTAACAELPTTTCGAMLFRMAS